MSRKRFGNGFSGTSANNTPGATIGEKRALKDYPILNTADLDQLRFTIGVAYGSTWRKFNTADVQRAAFEKSRGLLLDDHPVQHHQAPAHPPTNVQSLATANAVQLHALIKAKEAEISMKEQELAHKRVELEQLKARLGSEEDDFHSEAALKRRKVVDMV